MTLEIKAGGWYRTRSGGKAFVGYEHEHGRYQWVGHIEGDAACAAWCWDGRYSMHADNVCDLVAEWEDEPEPEPEPEKPTIKPGWYAVNGKTHEGYAYTNAVVVVRASDGVLWWRYAGESRLYRLSSREFVDPVRLEPTICDQLVESSLRSD